jgi:putative colanic acid biosynthesis acetyltransferase WcaF
MARVVWNCVWFVVCKLTFRRVGNSLRIFVLRTFGARIGDDVWIYPSVRIWLPWKLNIGSVVVIGADVEVYNYDRVTIGNQVAISRGCFLCTGTHDYTNHLMPLIWRPVSIGNECWLANDVFVCPGVEIGNRCVVGARSVVTKNISEGMVCAGNPCRPLKERVIQK